MITYLAVGKTGLGKSTYANLLCGANAPVSSSSDSKTKNITPYTSECKKYRYIDTIGLQDSEENGPEEKDSKEKKEKLDDEEIFERIMKEMYNLAVKDKSKEFKVDLILWFIDPSYRMSSDRKREAKFIQRLREFGPEDVKNDVWKSVIIITGNQGPKLIDNWYQGARAAVESVGCDASEIPTFVGWVLGCNPKINFDQEYKNKSKEDRHKDNVYTKKEIREKFEKLRERRKPFTVYFTSEKCIKCPLSVDPRILKGLCHPSLKRAHGERKECLQHSEELRKIHSQNLRKYHSREIRKYHIKDSRKYHSGGKEDYHSGEVRNFGALWDQITESAILGSMTAGGLGMVGGMLAGLTHAAVKDPSCVACGNSIKSRGCITRCTNCKRDLNEDGCKEEYPCCGRNTNDVGCKEEYPCCGRNTDDIGCKEEYPCCGRNAYDEGCKEEYPCCKKDKYDEGCRHKNFVCELCKKDFDKTNGCVLKCCKCNESSTSSGCEENKHCVNGSAGLDAWN